MKKLFTTTAALTVLLAGVWLGATWFIGLKTEENVRRYFGQSGGQHQLLDYKRSLLHSTAVTRLNVSQTPLGQWLDELPLTHKITHGPLSWKPSPQLGWSFWQTRLDSGALDDELRQQITAIFAPDQDVSQPLSESLQGSMTLGFDQLARYQLTLAPLLIESDEEQLTISLAGAQLDGQFVPEQQAEQQAGAGTFDVVLNQLELSNPEIQVSLPELKFQQAATTGDISAVTSPDEGQSELRWEAEDVSISFTSDPQPMRFKLSGHSATDIEAGQSSGNISLLLERFSGLRYPLQKVDFSLDYAGVNAAALTEINRLQNHMQDLQAQRSWQANDLELPEGRRQLFQLDVQLREATDQLLAVFFQKALTAETSTLNTQLVLQTENGDLESQAKLSYAGTERKIVLDDLVQGRIQDWLPLLRGDVQLSLAQAALPPELELLLFYPLQQGGLVESDGHYRMQLSLLDNEIGLNGKVLAYKALAEQFLPVADLSADPEVPEDVWLMVEEQGFSDELLKQLERRDDVSPEALELMRELQETTRMLQH
ncbi:MAG: DUF945 family protein [Thiolinea sp.]